MFQDVIATIVEAIEDGITVTEAEDNGDGGITVAEAEDNGDGMNVAMVEEAVAMVEEATTETRSKTSYSTSQESRKIKRIKSSALGTAVIGNTMKNTATSRNTTTKSNTCDIDDVPVIWMQLIAERDPQKPVDLIKLKSARIRSVFPIVRCINNKDDAANWEPCILVKVWTETWEVLNAHQTD